VVYHDAYQYFEKQFGLHHQFALLDNPEVSPGIQQLINVRKKIEESRPSCLLIEPDSNPNLIDTALGGHALNRLTIDLLGNQVSPEQSSAEENGYLQLMKNLAAQLQRCLY